jgi:hypothetical protein
MKTNELTGKALNWAVGKAEGLDDWLAPVNYCGKWEHGGPIIEREGIDICTSTRGGWIATLLIDCEDNEVVRDEGETCLIAAMRCYVASVLGDDVDVPKELT